MVDFQSSFQNVTKSPWLFWLYYFYFFVRIKFRAQNPLCDCNSKTDELLPVLWRVGAMFLLCCGRKIKSLLILFFLNKFWGNKAQLDYVAVPQKWLFSQSSICLSPTMDENSLKKVKHACASWELPSISFHLHRCVGCYKSYVLKSVRYQSGFLPSLITIWETSPWETRCPLPRQIRFQFFTLVAIVLGLGKPKTGVFDQKSSSGAHCRCKHGQSTSDYLCEGWVVD